MNTSEILSILHKYKNEQGFSGVVLLKSEDETIVEFNCGYANMMYKIENTMKTAFDTASITKLFTASAIVLLESRGQISFEDYIHGIIDLSGTAIPKDVKIKHLLTHTSGIADDAEEEKGEEYSDLFIHTPNYSIRENGDFIKNFAYKKPNCKVEEKIYYNNCAFILLGLAIEKITGKNYRDFVSEEIFNHFGMHNTFFMAKEETKRAVAEGYYRDKDTLKKNIYSFPPIGTADSGAYTTAEDLDIFMRKIHTSPVFSKMMERQTTLSKMKNDHKSTMGFALELEEENGEIYSINKDGSNYGVCNITAFYPKHEITLTILGNVDCNIWKMHLEIEKKIRCASIN